MSIYSTNILSVGLSVRLQKAKELRYLWMLSSLFKYIYLNLSYHCIQDYISDGVSEDLLQVMVKKAKTIEDQLAKLIQVASVT